LIGITWVAAAGSALVDNIPFTTAMIPVVKSCRQAPARRATTPTGGRSTLGRLFRRQRDDDRAAANVAAAGMAERAGRPIGFFAFLKVGLPATVSVDCDRHRIHRQFRYVAL
jgi:hypothetical protein